MEVQERDVVMLEECWLLSLVRRFYLEEEGST